MQAIRLTFDIAAGKATFRSARRLEMRVPPERNRAAIDGGSGIWIELRDGEQAPIYRRVIEGATFNVDTEVRTGASDRPFARRQGDNIRRVFNAVVPDDPRAVTAHILARRPGSKKKAPEEIARVALGKD